jgi:UDP-glucose 4-epimerase
MRVLVTGGAGYIGSVVVEELLKDDHQVTVFDNLSKGHRASLHQDAHLVKGDLLEKDFLVATLKESRVDAVVHMAAHSLVGESVANPGKYYHNNAVGSLSLIDAMLAAKVKRLVFSSTAAVYGEPSKQPIEEDDPTGPTNPYGETKLSFERALRWYDQAHELRSVSLRYFNAAGATERCGEWHDPETHLIPLVLQVAAGTRSHVEICGDDYPTPDGTCVRDYIHVVDLARAHILALNRLDQGSATYNLGCGGRGDSVKEVIEIATEVTGRPIETKTVARRQGDPAVLIASSERIERELGWKPQFQDLRIIIASSWRWLQNHPHGFKGSSALPGSSS